MDVADSLHQFFYNDFIRCIFQTECKVCSEQCRCDLFLCRVAEDLCHACGVGHCCLNFFTELRTEIFHAKLTESLLVDCYTLNGKLLLSIETALQSLYDYVVVCLELWHDAFLNLVCDVHTHDV